MIKISQEEFEIVCQKYRDWVSTPIMACGDFIPHDELGKQFNEYVCELAFKYGLPRDGKYAVTDKGELFDIEAKGANGG